MSEYKENLFYGASSEIQKRAKELRKRMTETEKNLWQQLRDRKILGCKFRRQHPIARFIADFYCHELKLVIELDGSIHNLEENREYDIGRTVELEKLGIKVVRFRNEEVLTGMQIVSSKIESICQKRISFINTSPKSSPSGEDFSYE